MIEAALGKVRVEAAKKRLRINDRFKDFDSLRSGIVTLDQFRRCLAMLNCNLTDAEITAIGAAFPGKLPNTVSYHSFSTAIQKEEAPLEFLSSLRSPPASLGEDLELAVERFNETVVLRVMTTGVDVFSYFKDFDKHNVGLVTEAQFERCFPIEVQPRILQALKKKYSDGNGHVLYHGWCGTIARAVDANERARSPVRQARTGFEASSPRSANGSPTRYNNPDNKASASQLVSAIAQQVAANKLRCDEVFHDYDKTHTNHVTAGQFFSALGRLKLVKFQLTQSHLETLAKAYGSTDSCGVLRVNYTTFLNDVMPNPLDANVNILNRTLPMAPLPASEERAALAVVEKVRHLVETCRISLKPVLQDFDRSIKGLYQTRSCTKTRFMRALAINKISLPPRELELLCKRYAVQGADGQLSDDINYVAFCADVERHDTFPTTRSSPLSGTAGSGFDGSSSRTDTQTSSPSVGDILKKIATQTSSRKIRLGEFFKDFDPLRSGLVSADKLGSAIAIAGLRISQPELDVLTAEYISARAPKHVDISRFLADMDRADSNIETTAAGSYSSASLRSALQSTGGVASQSLSGADLESLGVVIQRISEHVKHHGLLLPPFFCDYDRHHTGRITKTQFRQTISRHRLPASETEAHLLCRAYGDSTCTDMVLYRSFIGDIDDAENVSLQLSLRSTSRKPLSPRAAPQYRTSEAATDSVMAKVAEAVVRTNIRLDEYFHDADSLRHRCIPSCRFRGALGIVGIQLSEGELRSIESAYRTDRILDGVDYVAFTGDIQRRVVDLKSQGGAKENATQLAASSAADRVVAAIRKAFAARRLSVRTQIQDFDKLRKGTVTEPQLLSCLTASGVRLEPSDVVALRQAFGVPGGLMSYPKFCELVDANK